MKVFVRGFVAGLVLVFAGSTSATAQLDHTNDVTTNYILTDAGSMIVAPPSCVAGFSMTSFNFQECSGAWSGNNEGEAAPPESAVEDYINTVWGLSESGTSLDFGNPGTLMGEFVLAVKGSNEFSLFYFANHDGSALSFEQAMLGVSVNRQGRARGVSHVTLYGGDDVSVPEPGTMLLMATGLLGMAVRRREEDDA